MNINKECCICLLSFNLDDNKISKWNCKHFFHKECIVNWNNNCPLCRCQQKYILNNKINNKINNNNILNINSIIQFNIFDDNIRKLYLDNWNDKYCLEDNHNFLVCKTYGVLVICKDCNTIQCMNKLH